MKLLTKLYVGLGAVLFAGLMLSGLGSWYLRRLSLELETAVNRTAVTINNVNGLRARGWEMTANVRGVFVYGVLQDLEKTGICEQGFLTARQEYDTLLRQTRPLLSTPAEQAAFATLEAAVRDYEGAAADFIRFSKSGQTEAVRPLAARTFRFAETVNITGRNFSELEMAALGRSRAEAAAVTLQSKVVSITLTCLLLAVSAVALVFVRGASHTLGTVMADLLSGAHQVSTAAAQVSAASQSLAQGSSQQVASLEETSASSEEIHSMARRNTEGTRQAAGLVGGSEKRFIEATQSLRQMVEAMAEIHAESNRISKIIKVIDEIAFQTNILALNAAVEAARAGESGLGFAVVADEVRTLAQRSAQAARDTAELIESSIAKSTAGKSRVDQLAAILGDVTRTSTEVRTLVDEVNLGSQEQARGIEQISTSLAQMERVTQTNAANAEQAAAAASTLDTQSANLEAAAVRLLALVGEKS